MNNEFTKRELVIIARAVRYYFAYCCENCTEGYLDELYDVKKKINIELGLKKSAEGSDK